MLVQKAAGPSQKWIWKSRDESTDVRQLPSSCCFAPLRIRESIICQQLSFRAEPVFENNQTLIVEVGAAEIDLFDSVRFAFFYQTPE